MKLFWILLICLLLTACSPSRVPPGGTVPTITTAPPGATEPTVHTPPANIKAMWLTQFDMAQVYRDGDQQRQQEDFFQKADKILENVKAMGFNTVFLQLRPYADSMYPSAFYPMSSWVTGELGRPAAYDPVALVVQLARQKGLSIHGWINPMRGMTVQELTLVSQDYPLGQWATQPDKLGTYLVEVDGRWYLNPAYPEVRQLIADGAREAMERYDLDGLHIDDYFYPTTAASFDRQAYEQLGFGRDLADFRRQNLNVLVSQLYRVAQDAGGVFGVSPAGNIQTVYEKHYADVYAWCSQPGYVDYLCPQVYFGMEHENYDFVRVCQTFSGIIRQDSVKLVVGMTFGKALSGEDPYAGSGKNEWKAHKDILMRCLQSTAALPHCRGVAVFCYQYFYDPVTGQPVEATRQERENFLPVFQNIDW